MQRCLAAMFMAAFSVLEGNKVSDIDSLEPPPSVQEDSIASLVAAVKVDYIPMESQDGSASSEQPNSIASLVAVVKGNNENMIVQDGFEVSPGPAPAPGPSAPASAPETAPGNAPGPASVVAASPFGAEEEVGKTHMPAEGDAKFTKRLRGVDYYLLSANLALKKSFESAVKVVLAAQVAGGLDPKDVTLNLSAGSVIINASFANPQNLSSLTQRKLISNLCSNEANVDADLLAAVSNLPGFKDTTTNTLSFDKSPHCKSKKAAPTMGAKPRASPSAQKALKEHNISYNSVCDPPCMQGRGICGDGVCFCEDPYTGLQCEDEVQVAATRVYWVYVIPIIFVAGCLGILLAEVMWRTCLGPDRDTRGAPKELGQGKTLVRHEVWKPMCWKSTENSAIAFT